MIKNIHRMTISEFAELCNVTPQTIRWYDQKDIVHPCVVAENGYRYYDITQCTYVYSAKQLQAMGFSLENIKVLLEKKMDSKDVTRMMQERKEDIEREIRYLEQKKEVLEKAINNYSSYNNLPPADTIMYEWRTEREILLFDAGTIKSERDYLVARKEFFRFLHNWNPNLSYYCIGALEKQEKLDAIPEDEYLNGDYLFIEKAPWNEGCGLPSKKLPQGVYLSAYTNTYKDDYDVAIKLLEHIREKGYGIAGDLIVENPWEFSMPFTDDARNYIEFIRIPVSFK